MAKFGIRTQCKGCGVMMDIKSENHVATLYHPEPHCELFTSGEVAKWFPTYHTAWKSAVNGKGSLSCLR